MSTKSTGCAPGAWGTLRSTCSLKMLRAFGQPVQHLSQHLAKMLQDVAFRCCERLAMSLNQRSSWVYVTCSVTRGLPIPFGLRYSIFFARSFLLRYLFWFVDVCLFLCVTLFNLLVAWFFSLPFLFSFVLALLGHWNFHSFHRHWLLPVVVQHSA